MGVGKGEHKMQEHEKKPLWYVDMKKILVLGSIAYRMPTLVYSGELANIFQNEKQMAVFLAAMTEEKLIVQHEKHLNSHRYSIGDVVPEFLNACVIIYKYYSWNLTIDDLKQRYLAYDKSSLKSMDLINKAFKATSKDVKIQEYVLLFNQMKDAIHHDMCIKFDEDNKEYKIKRDARIKKEKEAKEKAEQKAIKETEQWYRKNIQRLKKQGKNPTDLSHLISKPPASSPTKATRSPASAPPSPKTKKSVSLPKKKRTKQ